jgi:hypothetical protein
MTTVRQERIGRLNALDEYADRKLATEQERALEAREIAAIEERIQRQPKDNGNGDGTA